MRNHTHTRDGIEYSIEVSPLDNGFTAAWTCPRCKATGQISELYEDEDAAALAARARLFSDHHSTRHHARA
jgi:hypothetical protein